MPEQNEKNLPKAPAFNPKVKETIAAFKENNNPKNLNDILNELVRSPLLAPAVFDLQGQPAPKPEADGRVQLPKETKISLVMVTSPEGKRYYLGFSDWDAVHEWQNAQPKAAQQIILLRFDDYANMIAKNAEASGLVINPGDNSLRLEPPADRVRTKRRRTRFPRRSQHSWPSSRPAASIPATRSRWSALAPLRSASAPSARAATPRQAPRSPSRLPSCPPSRPARL